MTILGSGTSTGVPVPTCACAVCASADPRDKRLRPSVLLEWDKARVLVDTATDLRAQLLRHRIERVDAVLYTHAHADHILGMDELRVYNWRQGGPIPVYGSPATLQALSRTFSYVFESTQVGGGKPAVHLNPVDGPFPLLGREVIPVPVFHGRLSVYGYRVGRFAYLTDTSRVPEPSLPLLVGLDVLILSALRPRPHPTHLHLDGAIEVAARIGARRTILTHMGHEMPHAEISARLPEGVELAYDGRILEIEEERR